MNPFGSIMTVPAKTCDIDYMVILPVFLRIDVMVILNMLLTAYQASAMLLIINIVLVGFISIQSAFAVFPCLNVFVLQLLEIA